MTNDVSCCPRCHVEGRPPTDLPVSEDPADADADDGHGGESLDDKGVPDGGFPAIEAAWDDAGDWVDTAPSDTVPRLPPIERGHRPGLPGDDVPPLGPLATKATLHTATPRRCTTPPSRSLYRKYWSNTKYGSDTKYASNTKYGSDVNRDTPLPPRCTPDDDYAFEEIYGATTPPLINEIMEAPPGVPRCILPPGFPR